LEPSICLGTVIVAGADGIFKVVSSGEPVRLTEVDRARHERFHLWPRFLADGRRFLFTVQVEGGDLAAVYIGSTDGTSPRKVVDASAAQYLDEHLLFVREGKLFAQRCDFRTLVLSGDSRLLADAVALGGVVQRQVAFSASRNGVVVFRESDPDSRVHLVEYDREGHARREVGEPGRYANPALSPDGTRLLVGRFDNQRANIFLVHLQRDTMTRLTFGTEEHDPVWSPDGKRMIYAVNADGAFALLEKDISGGGDAIPLLRSDVMVYPNDWSPDGRTLIYTRYDPQTLRDLWTMSLPDRKSTLWLQTPTTDDMATFSPDGRWVAYVSGDSGRGEVYVRSREGGGGKWQVSATGGRQPRWRADGRELFFVRGAGSELSSMMAVAILASNPMEFGAPRKLFDVRLPGVTRSQWVPSPDGERFIIETLKDDSSSSSLEVITNWTPNRAR
jgi:dipeptidyl aminopeptidase/acylaminoacyl peptidase